MPTCPRRMLPLALPSFLLAAAACSNPEIVMSPGESGGGGAASSTSEGTGFVGTSAGTGGTGGVEPGCEDVDCRPDQRCEIEDGQGTCVNNTCDDLNCDPTEQCQMTPEGGAICVDISCQDDLQCPFNQFCNGTICVADACTAGERACDGEVLMQCVSNGSTTRELFTCGGEAYYESICTDDGMGIASCPCEDDWDCPTYASCEVGSCTGTGAAPTCLLPPEPFASVLPQIEIQWGGQNRANSDAADSPFPVSAQNVMTPLVANLDDDNGDGLINELDFPEIIFTTFCGSTYTDSGVLRAIHGGGPKKGSNYFAVLGAEVWREGAPFDTTYACADATLLPTAGLAVGDLDDDGVPEIVAITELAGLQIFSNEGKSRLVANNLWTGYNEPSPAIANIDGEGLPEIVVGAHVFTLRVEVVDATTRVLSIVDHFQGKEAQGIQGSPTNPANRLGPISCVANLKDDHRLEIVAGSTAYALPRPPEGVKSRAECAPPYADPEATAFCKGELVVVWDGQAVNGTTQIPIAQRDGFCAVADLLGADQTAAPGPSNPLDQVPEVILFNNGYFFVLNGQNGTIARRTAMGTGAAFDGGAPNVDDFDGDGFPEVGTAFGGRYVMLDLQEPTAECPAWPNALNDNGSGPANPARAPNGKACTTDEDCGGTGAATCNTQRGTCVCYHSGWRRVIEDNSSRSTGSSVFDFNGDGAAEVIYNDECYFRIYDGVTGNVLFKEHSPSRTRTEYPVVADVDNDGNAEIVFATSNESDECVEGVDYNNGLEVWGNPTDLWVSARRIWNQNSYHVTNVLESGGIPVREPESWKTYGGRVYNTYRSNPRSYGIAPDLALNGIQISSPDATCGELTDNVEITVRVENLGDLRVGPGVALSFYGEWDAADGWEPLLDETLEPLQAILQTSIEPHSSLLLTVSYNAANSPRAALPGRVRAVVDESASERECNEGNNEQIVVVDEGDALPDLQIEIGRVTDAKCNSQEVDVPTTVTNAGSAPASDVRIRYYAGDPGQGGTVLHEETVAGPIAPGDSVNLTATIDEFPWNLSILIYGVVDPDGAINECNDGNNKDAASDKVVCEHVE
ncbi:FG-GAP-like repeat-containing protein [Sorangium sp. So ce1078]|uniref:FG-GAP-like repeat-containing protein n=1 Tax=Sorangium sp. So ce1078 TaxID=3133329 RepID=UPI003F6448BA